MRRGRIYKVLPTDDHLGDLRIVNPARLDATDNPRFTPFFVSLRGAAQERQRLGTIPGNRCDEDRTQICLSGVFGDITQGVPHDDSIRRALHPPAPTEVLLPERPWRHPGVAQRR